MVVGGGGGRVVFLGDSLPRAGPEVLDGYLQFSPQLTELAALWETVSGDRMHDLHAPLLHFFAVVFLHPKVGTSGCLCVGQPTPAFKACEERLRTKVACVVLTAFLTNG